MMINNESRFQLSREWLSGAPTATLNDDAPFADHTHRQLLAWGIERVAFWLYREEDDENELIM